MKRLSPIQKYRFNLSNQHEQLYKIKRIKRIGSKRSPKSQPLLPFFRFFSKTSFFTDTFKSHDESPSLDIPHTFSFIDNPDGTIKTIGKLIYLLCESKLSNLNIDHSKCEMMDLAASTVLDVIIMNGIKEWKIKNYKTLLSGNYSTNPKVNELLKVVGLLKHIDHSDSKNVPAAILKNYDTFPLFIGQKEGDSPKLSTSREIVATRLTDYFNILLKKISYKLTDVGRNQLSILITEVLDNIEQHSNAIHWYIMGYMDNDQVCNIVIFNLGRSIFETLSNANLDRKTKSFINELINKHTSLGFFGVVQRWTEENLWTLYALQEGVSRFNTMEKSETEAIRGLGMTKLIDFFLKLSSTVCQDKKPNMVIISGKTYILFDGTYNLYEKELLGGSRKLIAFNKENDFEKLPDRNYVYTLDNGFPGTILSMRFQLDKKYLEEHYGKQNNK
jgi:hypothetical protein